MLCGGVHKGNCACTSEWEGSAGVQQASLFVRITARKAWHDTSRHDLAMPKAWGFLSQYAAGQGNAEQCKLRSSRAGQVGAGQGRMQGGYLLHQFVPGWIGELQNNFLAGTHCSELHLQDPDIPITHQHHLARVDPRPRWMQSHTQSVWRSSISSRVSAACLVRRRPVGSSKRSSITSSSE